MIFLISLALALTLAAFCAEPLRKRPAPFYVSAVLIAAGVSVCALADVQFPLWFKAWVWPIFARGALAGALFVLVMLAGAFPNGSAGAKRLMPLRGPLSILACILTLGHNIAYGKTYFVMLFLQPWHLPLTQKLASWCSVAPRRRQPMQVLPPRLLKTPRPLRLRKRRRAESATARPRRKR